MMKIVLLIILIITTTTSVITQSVATDEPRGEEVETIVDPETGMVVQQEGETSNSRIEARIT